MPMLLLLFVCLFVCSLSPAKIRLDGSAGLEYTRNLIRDARYTSVWGSDIIIMVRSWRCRLANCTLYVHQTESHFFWLIYKFPCKAPRFDTPSPPFPEKKETGRNIPKGVFRQKIRHSSYQWFVAVALPLLEFSDFEIVYLIKSNQINSNQIYWTHLS